MKHIVIFDHVNKSRVLLEKKINRYLEKEKGHIKLSTCDKLKIEKYVKQDNQVETVYILVTSDEAEFFELGNLIKSKDKNADIYLINSKNYNNEYVKFLKNINCTIFKENALVINALKKGCMTEENLGKNLEEEYFTKKTRNEFINIKTSNIMYFCSASNPHCVIVETNKNRYEFPGKLINKKKFGKFFSCHRSFVVNISNIESINTKELSIRMTNGSVCFVTRSKLKKLLELLNSNNISNK